MKMFEKIKAKIKNFAEKIKAKINFKHLKTKITIVSALAANYFIQAVFAADDMTSTITEWLPTIITFAMLGMVLGMLKKFGKI